MEFLSGSLVPLADEAQNDLFELLHVYPDGDVIVAVHTTIAKDSNIIVAHIPKGGGMCPLMTVENCDLVEVAYQVGRPWIIICIRNPSPLTAAASYSTYWVHLPSIEANRHIRRQDMNLVRMAEVIPRIKFLGEVAQGGSATLHFLCFGKIATSVGFECHRYVVSNNAAISRPSPKTVVKDFSWFQMDTVGSTEAGSLLVTTIQRERSPKTGMPVNCILSVHRFQNCAFHHDSEVIHRMTIHSPGPSAFHISRAQWNHRCLTGRLSSAVFVALIPDSHRSGVDGSLDNILLCYQSEASVVDSTVTLVVDSMASGKRLTVECNMGTPWDVLEGTPSVTFFRLGRVLFALLQGRFLHCLSAHVVPTVLCSVPLSVDLHPPSRAMVVYPSGSGPALSVTVLLEGDGAHPVYTLWRFEANADTVRRHLSEPGRTEAEACGWLTCAALLDTTTNAQFETIVQALCRNGHLFSKAVVVTYIVEALRRVLVQQDDTVLRRLGSRVLRAIPSTSGYSTSGGVVWTCSELCDVAGARSPVSSSLCVEAVVTLGEPHSNTDRDSSLSHSPIIHGRRSSSLLSPKDRCYVSEQRSDAGSGPLSLTSPKDDPLPSVVMRMSFTQVLSNVLTPKMENLTLLRSESLVDEENVFGGIIVAAKLCMSRRVAHGVHGRNAMELAEDVLMRLCRCFDGTASNCDKVGEKTGTEQEHCEGQAKDARAARKALATLEHIVTAVEHIPLPPPREWRDIAGRLAAIAYPRMVHAHLTCAGHVTAWADEAVRPGSLMGSQSWADDDDHVSILYAGAATHSAPDNTTRQRMLELRVEDRCVHRLGLPVPAPRGTPPDEGTLSPSIVASCPFGPVAFWASGPSFARSERSNVKEVAAYMSRLMYPLVPPKS